MKRERERKRELAPSSCIPYSLFKSLYVKFTLYTQEQQCDARWRVIKPNIAFQSSCSLNRNELFLFSPYILCCLLSTCALSEALLRALLHVASQLKASNADSSYTFVNLRDFAIYCWICIIRCFYPYLTTVQNF